MSIENRHGFLETGSEMPKEIEYDRGTWQRLKREKRPVFVIDEARKLGVPKEVIDEYGRKAASAKEKQDGPAVAFRFMFNMKIGESSEWRELAERAHRLFMKDEDYGEAMAIAQDAFGKESEEWKQAKAANDAAWKKDSKTRNKEEESPEELTTISKNATVADLYDAMSDPNALHFDEELVHNFDHKIALKFFELRASPKGSAKGVLEFFDERDFSQKDIESLLPIKFSRSSGKKK